MTFKKHISIPNFLSKIRNCFEKIKDKKTRTQIPLVDCLMSGLAIFGLKFPSLLEFDKGRYDEVIKSNLKTLYGIEKAPCDTQMRERLDEVDAQDLRPCFKKVFSILQRQKVLEEYGYIDDYYLCSVDGTGAFSSHQIHCSSCCVKEHKDGSKTYYHQLLAAVIVHPEKKEVIPLCPEAILKQDGENKNDCERNAAKRLLEATRREHPHLKLIITEDGLASNAPHIRLLENLKMRYILGAKESDHKSLFEFARCVWIERDQMEEIEKNGSIHRYKWVNDVPLNDSNPDVIVNFLEYWEIPKSGKKRYWSWVTDIKLTKDAVKFVMKGGRVRWRIENETFNTLKNQGYHFERNFGHGEKNLCTNLAMLMFLAFFIDQAQQMCCEVFNQAVNKVGRKRYFWEKLRHFFQEFLFESWEVLYGVISKKFRLKVQIDSS